MAFATKLSRLSPPPLVCRSSCYFSAALSVSKEAAVVSPPPATRTRWYMGGLMMVEKTRRYTLPLRIPPPCSSSLLCLSLGPTPNSPLNHHYDYRFINNNTTTSLPKKINIDEEINTSSSGTTTTRRIRKRGCFRLFGVWIEKNNNISSSSPSPTQGSAAGDYGLEVEEWLKPLKKRQSTLLSLSNSCGGGSISRGLQMEKKRKRAQTQTTSAGDDEDEDEDDYDCCGAKQLLQLPLKKRRPFFSGRSN